MKKVLIAVVIFLVIAAGVFRLSKATTWQFFGEIVPRVETDRKVVALTFDDGPTDEHLDEILASVTVPATFFVIGGEIEHSPRAAAKLVAAGHELGNHTYSHVRMWFKSQAFYAREIERTDALIRAAGYKGPIYVRAPYGKKILGLPLYLSRHQRTHVTWDVEGKSNAPLDVIDRVRPGSIILLHPWYGNAAVRAALPKIIAGLKARGFQFVTVEELLAMRRA
jgi:peptidoglycan/xylan/chitin deacetylase (PgdA/CDA1 family)